MRKSERVPKVRLRDGSQVETKLKDDHEGPEYFVGRFSNMRSTVHLNTPVRYDTYGVGVPTSGDGTARVNDRLFNVDKAGVFYFGPNALIQITHVSEDFEGLMFGWTANLTARTGFNFSDRFWDLFAEGSYAVVTATSEQKECLLFLLNRLDDLSANRHFRFYDEMTRNYFIAFLYELSDIYRSNYGPDITHFTKKELLAANFLSRVPRYCRENRSLEFYARQLKVTSKYLSRVIKDLTSQTAGTMIDEAVILEAKLLLSNPTLSLSQVAEELHFRDQSIFGKFFKKYEGMAPSEYRLAV